MFDKYIVLKRTTFFILLNFLILGVSNLAHAVADFGNPGVLPVGRHQVTFRFGQVSEIQDKFSDSGKLQSPGRMNKRFDNAFLMTQAEFKAFAKIIDNQILNRDVSSEVDLGAAEFKGNASVDYFAPQIARGITSIWSIGVAVPFVRYRSDIAVMNTGINTFERIGPTVVSAEQSPNLDPKIGRQIKAMIAGPRAIITNKLEDQNYKPISGRDEQFVGDVVLGSSLKLYDSKVVDFYLLHQLTLPTGPKDDADDLLDLNIFGKTQLQTVLFTNIDIARWLELGIGVSYNWGIENDIEKRVPAFEGDDIPAASTKETLAKDPGDAIGAQIYSLAKLSDYYHLGLGYEMSRQQADDYSGSRNSRYDLLEKNTDKASGIAKFKFTYSAVDGFLRGQEKIPYSVTYAFADHLYGKNVERELTHEVLLKFYF
ncbi:MAG: hypothetical protein V4596_09390 [Bdellovibrionota bacterium]